ncbi:MAG: hypothetical protein IT532_12810 [Burkholderiales bacterium]|nr:hypothetical protein [Burkholderiales bacterium]
MKYETQGSVFGGYGFMNYSARQLPSHAHGHRPVPAPGRLRQLADQLLHRLQRR